MSIGAIVTLLREGIFAVLVLASPILFATLLVGLVIAIFQATTSIQEQTLTFVPKIITILIMLALLGSWMFSFMASYTMNIFNLIPLLVR
jgi:hypothetical protein